MDWINELYVKLYRRRTDDDLLLSWEARALWHEMLKLFDRSGLITTRRGALGLAVLVGIPHAVVESALTELEQDGRVRTVDNGFFAPNFKTAQEASKSDRLRQQESRELRRQRASLQSVTTRHEQSHGVTSVTDCHSDLIRSEQSRSDPSRRASARDLLFPEKHRRVRIPEDPGVFMVLDESDKCLGLVRIREDGSEEIVAEKGTQ